MFTEERIGEILRQLNILRYPEVQPVTGWKMCKQTGETKPLPDNNNENWAVAPAAIIWGGQMEYYSFKNTVTIPEEFAGKTVELNITTGKEGEWDSTNPQFSAYVNGKMRQGLDVNHCSLRLSDCASAGEKYDIYLSAFTGTQNFHLLFDAKLRTVDSDVTELYYDMLVPWETACIVDTESKDYFELISALEESINSLDLRKPGSAAYRNSIKAADEVLKNAFYTRERESEALIDCVGHTHIDVAWLWTLAVTRDKSVRSFSTVLELMKRYPEYLFMSSQPQLYKFVKDTAPDIYDQIKQRVAEGRWEAEGSMWLEPDCNLSSGEALIRQIIHGKQFFRREFGVDNEILWLPDVFGYSAALPQIMKKSNIRYFMTTKISWNEYNKIPYDSFYWKGIDGTKILTHFITTRDYESARFSSRTSEVFYSPFSTTYVGYINPSQMKGAWQRYQQKQLNDEVLVCYGHGDGGGGPTEEMLEAQRRLAYGLPGCPKTRQFTAREFFHNLEKNLDGKKVPVWTGELYLEYHRGTYTSMARNKKYNRRSEFALTNLENDSLIAEKLCAVNYPKQELHDHWEVLLRNQFHDILPGSSIYEVYEDSKKEYEKLLSFAAEEDLSRLKKIADGVGKTLVFNRNGQALSALVEVDENEPIENKQIIGNGKALAWAENVPAKGYTVLKNTLPDLGRVSVSCDKVETPFAILSFNSAGQISSWYDKTASRELLQKGKTGNVLMTYEDKPHRFDNWNIFDYYKQKQWPVDQLTEIKVGENGLFRSSLELKWQYQDSVIEETIYFYSFSPRVDFNFRTDWKEDQILLKALFPVAINSSEATFEIQYGNVKRSTAVNTSWDEAKFEVCYHKWMDISEGGYGVSFLNDCKYGVGIEENEVGLSLLKCGMDPNPYADREYHEATYSVMPHRDGWQQADTVQQAYLLNNPLIACCSNHASGNLPENFSLVSADQKNIMIEAVKKCEEENAYIVRLYEFDNRQTKTKIALSGKASKVWLCDMLENRQQLIAENCTEFSVDCASFEIVSLLIEE